MTRAAFGSHAGNIRLLTSRTGNSTGIDDHVRIQRRVVAGLVVHHVFVPAILLGAISLTRITLIVTGGQVPGDRCSMQLPVVRHVHRPLVGALAHQGRPAIRIHAFGPVSFLLALERDPGILAVQACTRKALLPDRPCPFGGLSY